MEVIVGKIIFLAIIVLIGFLAVKTRYVKEQLKDGLSLYLVRISLPCLVISTFSSMELSVSMLQSGLKVLIMAYTMIGLLLLLGRLTARLLHLSDGAAVVHRFLTACGNVMFLGFPIVQAVLGKDGLYYAMLYALANDSVVCTLGVFAMEGSRKNGKGTLLRVLNPNTLSLILGFLLLLTGIKPPAYLGEAIAAVGNTTTPVAMLFIGMMLASIRLEAFKKVWKAFVLVLIKMLLAPVAVMLLFSQFAPLIGVPAVGLTAMLFELSMPSPSIFSALAKEYGGDAVYAAQCTMVTTLCSFFTLPLIYYWIQTYAAF